MYKCYLNYIFVSSWKISIMTGLQNSWIGPIQGLKACKVTINRSIWWTRECKNTKKTEDQKTTLKRDQCVKNKMIEKRMYFIHDTASGMVYDVRRTTLYVQKWFIWNMLYYRVNYTLAYQLHNIMRNLYQEMLVSQHLCTYYCGVCVYL